MGAADGAGEVDEAPAAVVRIERPFYMGKFEVTNAQYAAVRFDARQRLYQRAEQGPEHPRRGGQSRAAARDPRQLESSSRVLPLAVPGDRARFDLPTEAQWEYACRAGTATSLAWGSCASDFGQLANLADQRVNDLARGDSPRWIPSPAGVNDGSMISDHVGKYAANAFGLCDMHGNVAEWTRTAYRPYPYNPGDGRDNPAAEGKKVVRGGSWYDRPHRARSSFRLAYEPWQRVFNVGFRVVMEADAAAKLAAAGRP